MGKSVGDIYAFVKSRKANRIQFEPHAITRLVQRNMNEDKLKEMMLNADILAIEKQKPPKFKLIFEGEKDINVIAKIEGKALRVITAFPSRIGKREK